MSAMQSSQIAIPERSTSSSLTRSNTVIGCSLISPAKHTGSDATSRQGDESLRTLTETLSPGDRWPGRASAQDGVLDHPLERVVAVVTEAHHYPVSGEVDGDPLKMVVAVEKPEAE